MELEQTLNDVAYSIVSKTHALTCSLDYRPSAMLGAGSGRGEGSVTERENVWCQYIRGIQLLLLWALAY